MKSERERGPEKIKRNRTEGEKQCETLSVGGDVHLFLLVFIRILAFSEAPITAVHVSVDGEPLGKGHSAGGPLYVLLWDPSLYLTGLHTIRVKVEVGTALHPQLQTFCVSQRSDVWFLCVCELGLGGPVFGARAALHSGGWPDAQLWFRAVLPPPH